MIDRALFSALYLVWYSHFFIYFLQVTTTKSLKYNFKIIIKKIHARNTFFVPSRNYVNKMSMDAHELTDLAAQKLAFLIVLPIKA